MTRPVQLRKGYFYSSLGHPHNVILIEALVRPIDFVTHTVIKGDIRVKMFFIEIKATLVTVSKHWSCLRQKLQ
mgnify:CR=1 FL=1